MNTVLRRRLARALGLPLLCTLPLAACGTTVPLAERQSVDGTGLSGPVGQATTGAPDPSSEPGSDRGAPVGSAGAPQAGGSQVAGSSGDLRSDVPGSVAGATTGLGPGIDAHHVYIGVPTTQDFDTAVQALGVNGLDTGDQQGDVKAVVAYINKHGGVLGRTLVPVFHDNKSLESSADPAKTAQVNCTAFTQDHAVAAVWNLAFQDDQDFMGCLTQHKVPFFSYYSYPVDDVIRTSFPYLFAYAGYRPSSYIPALVSRQEALGYFKPWDTANGKPGVGPVRIGIEYDDKHPSHERFAKALSARLKARGYDVAPLFAWDGNPSGASAVVLKFAADHVTHVYVDNTAGNLLIMQAAEQQHYRPRYAASAYGSGTALLEQLAPSAQLHGMLGIGSFPSSDVDPAQSPGDVSPAGPLCRQMLTDQGLRYTRYSYAEGLAFLTCDGIRQLAAALDKVGTSRLGPFVQAALEMGPRIPSSAVFANGFSPTSPVQVSMSRDLGYVDSCSCFRYLDRVNRPS